MGFLSLFFIFFDFYFWFRRLSTLWIKEFLKKCNNILEEKTLIRHFKHYYFILCFLRSLLKIDFIKDRKWHSNHCFEEVKVWNKKNEFRGLQTEKKKKKRTLINKSVWSSYFSPTSIFLICTFRVAQVSSVNLFYISGRKISILIVVRRKSGTYTIVLFL